MFTSGSMFLEWGRPVGAIISNGETHTEHILYNYHHKPIHRIPTDLVANDIKQNSRSTYSAIYFAVTNGYSE